MGKQVDFEKVEHAAKARRSVVRVVIYVLLTVWAIMVLFPFYWMILTSVKSYSAYNAERLPELFTGLHTVGADCGFRRHRCHQGQKGGAE